MPKKLESDPWFDQTERMWFKIVVELEKPRLFMKHQGAEHWVLASLMDAWTIAARAIFDLQSQVNFEVSLGMADEELDEHRRIIKDLAGGGFVRDEKLAGL